MVAIPNSPEGRTAYIVADYLYMHGQLWKMEVWRLVHSVAREEGVEGLHLPKLGDDPDGLDPIIAEILERASTIKKDMIAQAQEFEKRRALSMYTFY